MSDVKPLSEEEEATYRWWMAAGTGAEEEETARIFATLDAARRELSAERTRRERAEEAEQVLRQLHDVIRDRHHGRMPDDVADAMKSAAAWLATRTPTEPTS